MCYNKALIKKTLSYSTACIIQERPLDILKTRVIRIGETKHIKAIKSMFVIGTRTTRHVNQDGVCTHIF